MVVLFALFALIGGAVAVVLAWPAFGFAALLAAPFGASATVLALSLFVALPRWNFRRSREARARDMTKPLSSNP